MIVVIIIVGISVALNSIGQGSTQPSFQELETEYSYKPEVYKRDVPRFKQPTKVELEEETREPEPKPEVKPSEEQQLSRPQLARQKQRKPPPPLPLNLFTGRATRIEATAKNYAPYGRLVPCQLTITVESNSIDTPIIGLVTENVVHAGKVIIPAGAEVHGRASNERSRDRIDASGTWSFVWRTRDRMNGTELTVEGIALDRDLDFNTGMWGIRDGSAGLKGYLIKSDDLNEIRLFAATFLAAATQGIKDYDEFITDTGSSIQLAKNTAGNAALDGTTAVLEQYARQISEAIQRDGFYVRVPTGKQFYVYVTQPIDVRNRSRLQTSSANIWKTQLNHEG